MRNIVAYPENPYKYWNEEDLLQTQKTRSTRPSGQSGLLVRLGEYSAFFRERFYSGRTAEAVVLSNGTSCACSCSIAGALWFAT